MKPKILLCLWIAAGLLLLSACAQTRTLSEQITGSAILLTESKATPAKPSPIVSAAVSTIAPTETGANITLFPMPTPTPIRDYTYILFPMPTPTAIPNETPAPSASPSPTPMPTATAFVLPSPPPLPSYAPIPESVPFALSTPTPASQAEENEAVVEPSPEENQNSSPTATQAPVAPQTPVNPGSASGQDVADFAMQYVGYTYVYGAESPEEGFDCSGLVYYVYYQFGYTLNRTASAQSTDGVRVEHSDIQAGDVLCFYTSGKYIGHSGIYLGDGNYIHAQGTGYGVVVSPLSERGDNYEARRILS